MEKFPTSIDEEVERACTLYGADEKSEIGLYGGTFTAISNWKEILVEIEKKVKKLGLRGIRISTRPDEIKDADFLVSHSVTSVEIGAQSMCTDVLEKAKRGHTPQDVVKIVKLLKKKGMFVSVHLMTGLPGDTKEKSLFSAFEIAKLNPAAVRIHPTLVLKNTELAEMYESGSYEPQNLQEAVELVSDMVAVFMRNGIVIERLGMYQDKRTLPNVLAGPYHPAFGELCRAKLYEKFIKFTHAEKVLGPARLRSQIVGRSRLKIKFEPNEEVVSVSRLGKTSFKEWLSNYIPHIEEMARCDS